MGGGRIYRLHVAIAGSDPPIWRRILVPADISLGLLHQILQLALGWTDSHLHEFSTGSRTFGEPDPDDDDPPEDETGTGLDEVLKSKGDAITYLYDYGDGWEHEIVLEEILDEDPETTYPVCIAGERSGPPEDCGGIDGYAAFLEAISDPKHEQHEEMMEWIGGPFDPERFDMDWVNELLEAIGRTEWIGVMFPLPAELLENAPGRPWVVAWLDACEAVVIEHSVVGHDARHDTAVRLLEEALSESGEREIKRPDRIRVEDPEFAAAVETRLGDQVEIIVDETPEVDDIRDDLIEHVTESWRIVQSLGSYLSGEPGPDEIDVMFEAAAALYKANPWKKIRGRIAIEVTCPELELDSALMSLGGEIGENPGVYLVESPADQSFLVEPLSADLRDEDAGPEGPLRVLFYERGADVPQRMRREIVEHGWEVVDAQAYPKLLLVGSSGTPYIHTMKDLSIMLACLKVMTELASRHARKVDERLSLSLSLDLEVLGRKVSVSVRAPHPAVEEPRGEGSPDGYDALDAPDRKSWLTMSEGERMEAVEGYHEDMTPHPPDVNPTLHAITHVVVETQLAMDDPPAVNHALARLLAGGLDRHEAVHAIGSLVITHILQALEKKGEPDNLSYVEALDALTADTWRKSTG